MKKMIVIVILIAIVFCGCVGNETKTESAANYQIIFSDGTIWLYTFQDVDTGVWYFTSYHGGTCVRYNEDGTLYTGK